MRKFFLLAWLTLPVIGLAYHMGPGQVRLRLDEASSLAEVGESHARAAAGLDERSAPAEWAKAEEAFEAALDVLPAEYVQERRALRLEHSKARMFVSELPEANEELAALVGELDSDPQADPELLREARRAYASSQYYITWLMRLEGRTRADWEPEIELSRQLYKLIAMEAEESGDADQERVAREDLESAVRLARMDIEELQGLPLPSQ